MHRQHTLNVRGKLFMLDKPVVMGILNVTPDSFYDGGRYTDLNSSVAKAGEMIAEGAAMIDIGAMSSRPGSELISRDEEWSRLDAVIKGILDAHPDVLLSIDTIHAATATRALELGVGIVNDISGGRFDPEIAGVAAHYDAPFICMHMQGTPADMQRAPEYEDVVHEVLEFFVRRVEHLRSSGVKDIVLDPGFGFGKTVEHNYELLRKLGVFSILEVPVLAGISRKSMICKVINVSPQDALNGTTALHMLALQNGAGILRVHDVAEARQVIELYEKYSAVG